MRWPPAPEMTPGGAGPNRSRRACAEVALQPRLGYAPFALHRPGGPPEHFRGLVDRQAAEEPELHEPYLIGIDHGEPVQRLVNRENVDRRRRPDGHRVVDRHVVEAAAAFLGRPLAGV